MWRHYDRAQYRLIRLAGSDLTARYAHSETDRPGNVYAIIRDIAVAEKIDETYVGRVLRLTLLAPDIVEAILAGRQLAGVTGRRFAADVSGEVDGTAIGICTFRLILCLQLRLVGSNERTNVGRHVQQLQPLLFI